MSGPVWLFGYGSLVWRPGFPFETRRPACVHGVARRFWQGSTDHRGVPAAPGRVVTLVDAPGAVCWGAAYALAPAVAERVLVELDHRERDGYVRRDVELHFGDATRVPGVVWVAPPDNPRWLGDAPLAAIAAHVRDARGPSGSNADYARRLAAALRALGAVDDHVFAIETLLDDPRALR